MTTEPRYLVLRRWHGEIHSAVEFSDDPRTVREIKQNRATREEITIPEAMMGPQELVRRRRERN